MRVCILDYGSGNVRSVFNLVSALTPHAVVSNDPETIRQATHLILPGVGAFAAAMAAIRERVPLDVLEQSVWKEGTPFLGICVGLQVLADEGLEFGRHRGLGWLPGVVRQLSAGSLPLPHIGWNEAIAAKASSPLVTADSRDDFYFVHSYVFEPASPDLCFAVTEYGEAFCSIAGRSNVWGVQFHPEKSQSAGQALLERFLAIER